MLRKKNSNIFPINFKKKNNFGKLFLLPKIHKHLSNVHKLVISNCSTPTIKVSEFLDFYLKPLMVGRIFETLVISLTK